MKTAACLLFCLLFPAAALADEPGGAASMLLPAVLKIIAALGIVVGLLLLFYYFSRRGIGFFPAAKTGAIKTIEVRHLMPKKSLFLVEVRGKEFLLGVGADRIELISRVDWQPPPPFAETLHASMEETS